MPVRRIRLALGDTDEAIRQLQAAYEVHDARLIMVNRMAQTPTLALVRDHPVFREVIRQMAFPDGDT